MAKTQNLSLNPIKISGVCGKLMCCLRYEQESYESMQKIMPKAGKEIMTPDGVGTVLENNIISEMTKVKVTLADGTLDVRSYPFRDLEPVPPVAPAGSDTDSGGDTDPAVSGSGAAEESNAANTAPSDADNSEPGSEKAGETDGKSKPEQQPRERKPGEQNPGQNADNNQQNRQRYRNNRQHQRERNPQKNFVPKQGNSKPKQVY